MIALYESLTQSVAQMFSEMLTTALAHFAWYIVQLTVHREEFMNSEDLRSKSFAKINV